MARDNKQCVKHPNYTAAKIKSAETQLRQKQKRIEEYLKQPKLCPECNSVIPYERKTSNCFCSRSCARKHANIKRSKCVTEKSTQTLIQRLIDQEIPVQVGKTKKRSLEHIIATGRIPYTKIIINVCVVCTKMFYYKSTKRTCSNGCLRKNLCDRAKRTGLGGNKNNKAYGCYTSPTAGTVWLESSYELKVAQELDFNGVVWERPSYFNYMLNGQRKKYYPDFYLVEYDVYLDPKNDFLIMKDAEKIQAVSEQNNIKIVILSKNHLSWKTFQRFIS